jgi:succinate dehydrogenase / fumarate reductase membrane anchor subunit
VRFAFSGLAAWWVQRASAIFLLLFLLSVFGWFALHRPYSYAEWRAWIATPVMTITVLAFFAALLSHMWVGLRDVLLDYARPAALRACLLVALGGGLLGTAAWVIVILLKLRS